MPALYPASAVDKFPLLSPVMGLLVPGLIKPDIGLPAFDIGRILCDIPPGQPAEDIGLENEVPGLGACVRAFSSTSI